MRQLRFWLRSVFRFSSTEINGFIILCSIIILLLLIPLLYPVLFPAKTVDHTSDQLILDSLVAVLEKQQAEIGSGQFHRASISTGATITFFDFDPNVIGVEQWQSLGLPKYLAERIIKYRNKGGKFRTKSDLKKIYGFPEALYGQLYPHILLPDSLIYPHRKERTYEPKTFPSEKRPFTAEKFDINRADTLQLASVKGIGPVLSRRIIKYRDLLGGFVGPQQLAEVYGLDSLVAKELLKKGYLVADQPLRKLKINQASEKEFDAHPYITPRLAKTIVAYRLQHGNFQSPASLAPIKLLDEATLRKLTPYLSFE